MRQCDGQEKCVDVWQDGGDGLVTRVYWSESDAGVVVEATDSYTSVVFWSREEGQRLIDALTASLSWLPSAEGRTDG